jgi:hypothetical protein
MSVRGAKWCIRSIIFVIILSGCSSLDDELPPGFVHLMQAPSGRDFDALFEEATVQSEMFRRKLLAGGDPDFIDSDLLAKAILKFRQKAPFYLKGHKDIDGFEISRESIVEAVVGNNRISSRLAYAGFKGKWYGLWDRMSVDHHWGRLVEHGKPRRVEIAGDMPVWIRSYQYCWVGDGYGLNMVATWNPDSQSSDFLLGYVVHVEKGDLDKPTKRRPHVGIFLGKSKLIWVTAGEVFLEESFEISPDKEAYAITGFFYNVTEDTLRTIQCFQALYTREPDNRPAWFSFPLEIQVSR